MKLATASAAGSDKAAVVKPGGGRHKMSGERVPLNVAGHQHAEAIDDDLTNVAAAAVLSTATAAAKYAAMEAAMEAGDAAEPEQRRARRREAAGGGSTASTGATRLLACPKHMTRRARFGGVPLVAAKKPRRISDPPFFSFRCASPKGRGKVRKKSRPKSLHTGLVHFFWPRGSLLFSST